MLKVDLIILKLIVLSTVTDGATLSADEAYEGGKSSIEASVMAFESMLPADIIGEYVVTDIFDEVPHEVDKCRFRLQADYQQEYMRWASRQYLPKRDGSRAEVRYVEIEIIGRQVRRAVNQFTPTTRKFESFELALENTEMIWLDHAWLQRFPAVENRGHTIKRIVRKLKPFPGIIAETEDDKVQLVCTFDTEESGTFDTYTWTFSLPDYCVSGAKLERSIMGQKRTYFEQSIIYDERSDGVKVPTQLIGSGLSVRKDGRKFLVGERLVDLEMKWQTFAFQAEARAEIGDRSFGSVESISSFISTQENQSEKD